MTTTDTNKGNGRQQKSSSTNVKIEYIQKLSNDKALAEAIQIGNKPYFAVIDFRNIDDVKINLMESLAYNEDIRYKPILLSNRAHSFKDKDDFYAYIQKAEKETLDSLFDRTLALWTKYIDASDFHLKLCAADTIFTYFQDRLGMTHYIFFVADNDAGKSNNLTMFNILAYRNLMNNSMTYANVYNFLGDKDEGCGTICYDEADNLDENHSILGIFKEGYTTGRPVVRTLDTVHGKRQVKLNTYCFKAFAGERLPDALTAKGFLQRVVVLKCYPGFRDDDISEVVSPAGDDDFQELLDELTELRNTLFCYRLVHFQDKIPNIKLNIRNREKQLFKPVLRLFQGTRVFDTLRPVISHFVKERRQKKVDSYHAFLYTQVKNLIKSQGTLELHSNNIWEFMKLNLDWKEIPHKPQSIETTEFGVLSLKSVIQTLKEIFHAEPPRHTGTSRTLVFSKDILDKMKGTYEINIDIKVGFETRENHINETDETDETLSVGIDAFSSNNNTEENAEDKEENGENHKEELTNEREIDIDSNTNESEHPYNASHASHASQTPEMSTNRYQEEGTDSKTMCLKPSDCDNNNNDNNAAVCDLRNQEGADRFRTEVKRLGEEGK